MASFRYPGWTCLDPQERGSKYHFPFGPVPGFEIDEGTLARLKSPPPGFLSYEALAKMAAEKAEREEDEKEFRLFKRKITDATVDVYVKHRDEFFGSRAEYKAFAVESDKELNETKGLRRLIEFDKDPPAQTVFYRWVRKAYLATGTKNVPALIKAGVSEDLQKALKKVSVKYGKSFKQGGFNPRPMKDAAYRYRLGTISEHAKGNAVDIEDASNPIISLTDWTFIEKLCAKKVDRGAARWEKDPKALWTDVKGLSDAFAAKVAAEVKRIKEVREAAAKIVAAAAKEAATGAVSNPAAKPPAAPAPARQGDPIDEVLAGHDKLKPWVGGFFTLEWALVEQLQAHDFLWGATFGNAVDLHHFELE